MLQPSFFIVGAAKCGTTALCKYLDNHPNIFIPKLKELNYFDTDFKTNHKASSIEEYLAFFDEGKDKFCGEGSPKYLYSKIAAQAIYDFNPSAKIIIMLRDPVSMMYSLHSQYLYNGSSENVQDFETALALESERKLGRNIPAKCVEPKLLFYRERASYTEQIRRYFNTFGKAQVKIILFEDFTNETAAIFRETLEFIGTDPEFETSFLPINPNKKVRNTFLQSLIKYPPTKVLEFGKYLLPIPQSWRRGLLEKAKASLKRLNTQKVPRPPLDSQLRKRLITEFEPEIKQLEELIERDLSHWYQIKTI